MSVDIAGVLRRWAYLTARGFRLGGAGCLRGEAALSGRALSFSPGAAPFEGTAATSGRRFRMAGRERRRMSIAGRRRGEAPV